MKSLYDTWIMAKRSLRHTTRSIDTIITVLALPIFSMLMIVYVFGYAINVGSVKYIDYIVPGVIILTVVSGISYAAFRLNLDVSKGFINRFRSMPVTPSSILGGHVTSSVLSNLFSVLMVMIVALMVGFRSPANLAAWLAFFGILLLFTTALTWLAMFFGLLAKSAEGASVFSYILMFMVVISSAFTATEKMSPVLRGFAQNQPMTPIIETMRSLLINGKTGPYVLIALGWCTIILAISYAAALWAYKNRTT